MTKVAVIASERSERGNPQYNIDKVDCHDSTLRAESRNDDNFSYAKKTCHTERSEVSQNAQINRDISGFALNMTKKIPVL